MNLYHSRITFSLIFSLILWYSSSVQAEPKPEKGLLLDKIVAVVNDELILNSELQKRIFKTKQDLQARHVNTTPGPAFALKVLDSMIIEKLQMQKIKQRGLQISDEELLNRIRDIAQRNKLTLVQLREKLNLARPNGFKLFRQNIRQQLLFRKLQQVEVFSRTQVTEGEINNYLQRQSLVNHNEEYHLKHIVINLPESATPKQREAAKAKAKTILEKLNRGEDFSQMAVRYSEGGKALLGGDLGWLGNDEIPTFFANRVQSLKVGEHSQLIKSPIGFHIIKLVGKRDKNSNIVKQYHLYRFILLSDNTAKAKKPPKALLELSQKMNTLAAFKKLNSQFSDIPADVNANGNLGWQTLQEMPLSYADAISNLTPGHATIPIASERGWEILFLDGTREQDMNIANKHQQAMETLRRKKANETYEIWLRRLKDDALIDNRLAPEKKGL